MILSFDLLSISIKIPFRVWKYFHLMGKCCSQQTTHHSQCMEFLMQFWWMTIFPLRFMPFFLPGAGYCGCINIRACAGHVRGPSSLFMTSDTDLCQSFGSTFTTTKTPRQIFSRSSFLPPLWLMELWRERMQFKNCDEELFSIFVIYWLSNYRDWRGN